MFRVKVCMQDTFARALGRQAKQDNRIFCRVTAVRAVSDRITGLGLGLRLELGLRSGLRFELWLELGL